MFVAEGLDAVPLDDVAQRRHEEADIEVLWVPLDEAVRAVLDRRLCDSMAAAGLLALVAARS